MGFLDNIRDRLRPANDDYYDDDYYDDEYDDLPENGARDHHEGTGLLGNSRRPEAESVSVYTRSGRPLDNGTAAASASGYQSTVAPRPEYAPRPSEYREGYGEGIEETAAIPQQHSGYASHGSVLGNTTDGHTPGDIGLKPVPRVNSGQLPPYVLKPVSYDDVQMVVRRVRTNQPVVLVFKNTNIETAKRILDFSFGLACGIGGRVDELGDRVFAVMPQGVELAQADLDKLVSDGTIER
ncbi:MAG: cell division protein SepF [Olsenella sp.]|nr:cell division protein SepF [Olsenella sp.]